MMRQRARNIWLIISIVALVAIGVSPADASHVKGTYGGHGYQWFARYYDRAEPWVSSTSCNSAESLAYYDAENTTQYVADEQPEWKTRWPSGLTYYRHRCDGKYDTNTDIVIKYQSRSTWEADHGSVTGGGNFGGHNKSYDTIDDRDWCRIWNAPTPCGYKYSVVHVNKYKWDQRATEWRVHLILHETGHSLGFGHHCSSDSIMNTGFSDCNNGRFTQWDGYKATDRRAMLNVYPNWKYP